MKSLNFAVLSNLCMLVAGVLLVVWPGAALNYLVVVIGALFLFPGVIGILSLFGWAFVSRETGEKGISSLLMAVGSGVLGLCLIAFPGFFVGILMYVLGGLLIVGGVSQLMNWLTIRRYMKVPLGMYLVSLLTLATGAVVLYNPFEAATIPFIALGVSAVLYASVNLIRLLRYHG